MLPEFAGRNTTHNIFEKLYMMWNWALRLTDKRSGIKDLKPNHIDVYWADYSEKHYNTDAQRTGETPSAGTHGSARGFAKLASIMANGGSLNGQTLLSPEAWDRFHAKSTVAEEPIWQNRTIYT